MTIKEIYKMQKDLDDLIIKKKELDVDNKTLLNTRLLALFVELGEYEEEVRNWFANLRYLNPLGNPTSKEKALEEYVDCMHFIFSIANALDLEGNMEDYFNTSNVEVLAKITSEEANEIIDFNTSNVEVLALAIIQ